MNIVHLPWDSDFFGFKTGKIPVNDQNDIAEVTSLVEEAKADGYRLLYLFAGPEVNCMPVSHFFAYKDVKMTYEWPMGDPAAPTDEVALLTGDYNRAQLYKLALEAGQHSRFRLDTHMPADAFERMYNTWLENSLNGIIADEVFVYRMNDQIEGFVSLKHKDKTSVIGLIAVSAALQGKGAGTQLINAAKRSAKAHGSNRILVDTQEVNENACRFYLKNNFQLHSSQQIYHIWL